MNRIGVRVEREKKIITIQLVQYILSNSYYVVSVVPS